MDKITSDVRHQQWLEIIKACNASGLSKKEWCAQNGVNLKSFYYRQRQLRHEAQEEHSDSVPAVPEVTFAEVPVPQPATPASGSVSDFHPDAVIRTRTMTIEVSNTASQDVLSLIGSVIRNAT